LAKSLLKNGFSIVIPCRNEAENIPSLGNELNNVFRKSNFPWEVIWVNDASDDNTPNAINYLGPNHKLVSSPIRRGQSTSIQNGIDESKFSFIGLIDGDGQNNPADLLKMFLKIIDSPSLDFIQGCRITREDSFLRRRLPSLLANRLVKILIGSPLKDLGCGTKVFRKIVVEEIPFSGEIHRLYAAHAHLIGFKVTEVGVDHRPRKFGKSSYGYERIFKFLLDLMLLRFRHLAARNSYYFLGSLSLMVVLFGLALWVSAVLLRVLDVKDHFDGALTIGGLLCVLLGFSILMVSTSIEVLANRINNSKKVTPRP
jgi:glycosyltransferase involved in cell wall biosynthesis